MAGGRVVDAATTRDWVRGVLRHGSGPLDVWAIRRVMAGAEPGAVAGVLRARAGCSERWSETRDQGRAFGDVTTAMGAPAMADLPLPVALGVRALGMEAGVVALLFLQTFAAQMVSAAARFVPLGQNDAQMLLRDLHPVIARIAGRDEAAAPGSGAMMAEMDAMDHETLQPRLFRT